MNIDLLCCDKDIVYNYIKAINVAGYDVLDITVNNYSIAKESLLMDKSLKENVILLDIGRTHTYLTLLKNASVQTCEIIHSGINNFIQDSINDICNEASLELKFSSNEEWLNMHEELLNGNPKLKAIADYTTFRDNNNDGLADFLQMFSERK